MIKILAQAPYPSYVFLACKHMQILNVYVLSNLSIDES